MFPGVFLFMIILLCLTSNGSTLPSRETQTLDRVHRPTGQGVHEMVQRAAPWRRRRASGSEPTSVCSVQDLLDNKDQCCSLCPAGYHKSSQGTCEGNRFQCSPCEQGTFVDIKNTVSKCFMCTMCDDKVSMVELESCRNSSDTVCGCRGGYILKNTSEDRFVCLKSTTTILPLTSVAPPSALSPKKEPKDPQPVLVLLLFLVATAILMGVSLTPALCYRAMLRGQLCPWWVQTKSNYNKCNTHNTIHLPPETQTSASPGELCQAQAAGPSVESTDISVYQPMEPDYSAATVELGTHSPANMKSKRLNSPDCQGPPLQMIEQESLSESWPAPVLYAIIQEVPVRRWKEFLRLLRMPDGQMERAEMEAGPSYLEQQYQMLRQWSRRGGAGLGAVYAALQTMDLSGCADKLQEKLQQLQQQEQMTQADMPYCAGGAM